MKLTEETDIPEILLGLIAPAGVLIQDSPVTAPGFCQLTVPRTKPASAMQVCHCRVAERTTILICPAAM